MGVAVDRGANLHGAILQELFDYNSMEARVKARRAGQKFGEFGASFLNFCLFFYLFLGT